MLEVIAFLKVMCLVALILSLAGLLIWQLLWMGTSMKIVEQSKGWVVAQSGECLVSSLEDGKTQHCLSLFRCTHHSTLDKAFEALCEYTEQDPEAYKKQLVREVKYKGPSPMSCLVGGLSSSVRVRVKRWLEAEHA